MVQRGNPAAMGSGVQPVLDYLRALECPYCPTRNRPLSEGPFSAALPCRTERAHFIAGDWLLEAPTVEADWEVADAPDLSDINFMLWEQALICFKDRDALGILGSADSYRSLSIVDRNRRPFIKRGIYEAALLDALTATNSNNFKWSISALRRLISHANPQRLRAAGDPLPGPGPFTLFRGVAGVGSQRRERGSSWTSDREVARWFALRYRDLPDPALLTATFPENQILAFINDRQESEFVVMPGTRSKMTSVPLSR